MLRNFRTSIPPLGLHRVAADEMPGTHSPQQQWPRGPRNILHNAIKGGSIERILALLASGSIDINQGTPEGFTPLMIATLNDNSRVVRILLRRGANTSIADDSGCTALHMAASSGYPDVLKLLAKAGANLEAATYSYGFTPLHVAAQEGHLGVMRVLIQAAANPNSRTCYGGTPLFLAARNGHVDAVKVLLRAKADPLLSSDNPTGLERLLPLDEAAGNGHSEVVRELIQQFGLTGCSGGSDGLQTLVMATRDGHVEVMDILTGAGVVDTGGALLHGAWGGHEGAVKFLLQQRAGQSSLEDSPHVNFCDLSGRTPLVYAIESESTGYRAARIVRMLVDAGADTTSAVRLTGTSGVGPTVIFNDTPLALTTRVLREKKFIGGKDATEKKLHGLEAIRRLLLCVEAVHAVSWLWPTDVPCIVPAAAEDSRKTKATSTTLRAMLPILRRRTRRRSGVLLASAMFR